MQDDELDHFLEAARQTAVDPSEDLVARILADADAMQPVAAAAVVTPAKPGVLGRLVLALGGWPAASGLVTATLAGVWFGYAAPSGFDALSAAVWSADDSYELVDLMPTVDDLLMEGS